MILGDAFFALLKFLLDPPQLLLPSEEGRRLLCFPLLLFALFYLYTCTLSEALFPHLLSEGGMQGDTSLSLAMPSLLLFWAAGSVSRICLHGQV